MNSENINNTSPDSDEISLKELILKIQEWWQYLLSKWLIITLVGIVGGVIGFTYAYLKKPIYTATTTFVLEEEKSGGGALASLGGLASIAGIDLGGGGGLFQGDNIIELYKSRSMIQKTLLSSSVFSGKRQVLVDRFVEQSELRNEWSKNPLLKGMNFSDTTHYNIQRDSLMGVIVKQIRDDFLKVTKPDKKLSIINVVVSSNDELFSKAFAEQIVTNVNHFYTETKIKKSRSNVELLQKQTDSVRAVMNGSIYASAAVADATPNLNPTRQIQRAAPMQRSQFNAETNKAILSELVKNLELSKMSLRKEIPLIQIVDGPVLPLEKVKVGKLKGIILGALLFGVLACIYLITKRVFKNL